MSVAPNDRHQNQIQFALERGVPAWLGVLGTKRLPFPAASFDLAHCSRCRIDWAQRDGVLLMELDRLLRPGGYWVWSAPPVYRDDEENQKTWKDMLEFMGRMCWKVKAQSGQTAIFKKPRSNLCIKKRAEGTEPPVCDPAVPANAAWYTPMGACVNEVPKGKKSKVVAPWPERLVAAPYRVKDLGITADEFDADTAAWEKHVADYDSLLGGNALLRPVDPSEKPSKKNPKQPFSFRNVMDLNAHLGGFAAALAGQPVWVMNTVPPHGDKDGAALEVVYDRGLIGVYHDWCEAFSTYPRTYDLLHGWKIVSIVLKSKCTLDSFLLELDRILRPKGIVIFRDTADAIDTVSKRLKAIKWIAYKGPVTRKAADGSSEVVLVAQKRFWRLKANGTKEASASSEDSGREEQ
eukprot:TRINITY_DN10247_c0_g2_i3.p1 TRINITY_DN10247_c0_g2~~TRINITY_DN10247_c0_g2_i3.p1  ORF type:complete len:464 (-),score=34.83 TRINITY_DN10247_c0_g2_i3:225-1442(-)